MPRAKSKTLTEAEHRLMDILWEKGASSVGDVTKALSKGKTLAYTSVLTTLRILEQKGFVRHTKEGRAFTYHPIVNRNDVRRGVLKHVLRQFFNQSPELLLLHILEHEQVDDKELKRLKKMVGERK